MLQTKFYKIVPIKHSEIDILYYEVVMLNNIPLTKTGNEIEDNMRIESFLLHARNIIDFLMGRGHLKCSEFKDSNGRKITPYKVIPEDIIRRINEHLSHISNKRKTTKIQWSLLLLKEEINKSFLKFLKKISPDYFLKEKHKIVDFEYLLN